MGLGLSMVYGIIKQSGGAISLSSAPGMGSTFNIYLPPVYEEVTPEQPPPATARPAPGTETVLVVEDEEMVRLLALTILTAKGYKVLEASGGIQAISIAESCRTTIDLLITDVVMPELSGLEVVQHIAKLHPETKVLYMTGYTDSDLSEIGLQRSAVSLLTKPFTPRSLLKAAREVLDSSPGA